MSDIIQTMSDIVFLKYATKNPQHRNGIADYCFNQKQSSHHVDIH